MFLEAYYIKNIDLKCSGAMQQQGFVCLEDDLGKANTKRTGLAQPIQ